MADTTRNSPGWRERLHALWLRVVLYVNREPTPKSPRVQKAIRWLDWLWVLVLLGAMLAVILWVWHLSGHHQH